MAIPLSYNLRSLVVRRLSTLSAVLGIALVVTVFILVLALAHGFSHAVRTAGSPENAIILRKGSTAEVSSGIEREAADSIAVRQEISRGEGSAPLAVREIVVLVVLPRKADGAATQVVVRGTSPEAVLVRKGVRILEGGRMFRPGLPEIVVGRALAGRLSGLDLGSKVTIKRQGWTVVGVLDTGGTGFESEIWGDASLLQSVFTREGVFQSITARIPEPEKFSEFKARVEGDPKYEVEVKTEAQYYSDQAGTLVTFISILGTLVILIMSVGAVFGAMNTMYAAVGARSREICTLRALGFSRRAVLACFLLESVALSAAGGLLGSLFSLPLHGLTTSTINWDTFSELVFAFRLTPEILAQGFAFAVVMGVVGGLFPAIRAARLPITSGLRQI
jgi:ABC-type antimicrobial peptide transport system permease subunit